jgi:hypothetical protein
LNDLGLASVAVIRLTNATNFSGVDSNAGCIGSCICTAGVAASTCARGATVVLAPARDDKAGNALHIPIRLRRFMQRPCAINSGRSCHGDTRASESNRWSAASFVGYKLTPTSTDGNQGRRTRRGMARSA